MRHAFAVCVPESRESKEGLDHVHESLPWRDLHPHTRIAVARVPPIVPDAGVDDSRLALVKNAGLPVALHGQLPFKHGEPLNQSGMTVLPYDACSNKRG